MMKTPDDYARRSFERWIETPIGERLMGSYVNAFGDLRKLIAEEVESAITIAQASALAAAADIAEDHARKVGRVFGEAQDAAYEIAAAIRALQPPLPDAGTALRLALPILSNDVGRLKILYDDFFAYHGHTEDTAKCKELLDAAIAARDAVAAMVGGKENDG